MATKQKWRLITEAITDPMMHFAVEEALLRQVDEAKGLPTLRIRQTEPSVWIGYYQSPEEDVDIDYCKKNNLKIIRRLNSGGAVYQDFGTFCYSAFFNKNQFLAAAGLHHTDELYPLFGNVIIELCKKYGIQANLSPVNDITVNHKKIYGSAQLEWYSAFVHSGSILVNTDLHAMQLALNPSNLKFADKGFKSVKERVANLSELADIPSVEQVKRDFIESFAENINIDFVEQGFTNDERELANQLYLEKYSKHEWTFKVNKPHTTVLSTKIDSGVLILKCEVSQNIIQSAHLSGDFLMPDHNLVQQVLNQLKNKTTKQAVEMVKNSKLPVNMLNGLIHLFNQLNEQHDE